MQLTRILREGFIAGLIGAGAVALWFLIVDTIAGRPFFTPAMLGSLAWWNVAIGNAIAASGMGYYLWREHPKIKEALRLHPLGETEEGE